MRVAIIGGGCAGLTAAWHLAGQPGYEVHVYEKSWCLGGKGASMRANDGRILEHGLHVWLGFYENAFRMMRECYAEVEAREWGPKAKRQDDRLVHGSIDDAFFPEPNIGVAGFDSEQQFNVWSGFLPPARGLPGTPLDPASNPFTLPNYLSRCISLLKALMLSVVAPAPGDVPGQPRPDERSKLDESIQLDFSFDPLRSPAVLVERMAWLLRSGTLTTAAGLMQGVALLETWLRTLNQSKEVADSALQLLEAIAAQMRKFLRDVVSVDEKLRWKTEIIDIVMAIAYGLYRDRVLFDRNGLDAINNVDYRDWLVGHGATRTSVDSRFMTGIYDLVFAYRGGDRKRPGLAAGVALRGALRMFFTYRGSMFWRLRSGMGDAVFAPLYKVLAAGRTVGGEKRNPVHFHFLHTLTGIAMDLANPARRYVSKLSFSTPGPERKINALGASALDHFGSWPSTANLFNKATSAKGSTTTLSRGDQFDIVIFAMGVDDLLKVCGASDPEFFKRMPKAWKRMGEEVRTVATHSAQVWLDRDLEQLGWQRRSGIFTALDMPFNTWADMTHTLATERAWGAAKGGSYKAAGARSVAYFCGVRPNARSAAAKKSKYENVAAALDGMLEKDLGKLWPKAFGRGRTARPHVLARHTQENKTGSDRYTLSLPGTIESRISPLQLDVLNMTIAGDWTACGLDAGCVEAAVMSGMLAAHAITGSEPSLESIVGYDHP